MLIPPNLARRYGLVSCRSAGESETCREIAPLHRGVVVLDALQKRALSGITRQSESDNGDQRRCRIRCTCYCSGRLESLRTQIEIRDLLAPRGFSCRPVIGGDRDIDRGQHEQREQGTDRHARDHDKSDREPARRRWTRAAISIAERLSRPSLSCNSLANSTIRMPCLLIRPTRVSNPTWV